MAVDPISDGGDPQIRVATTFTHELFKEHARMVYGLCRALLRDPDDADDATQATFIAAYKSLLGGNRVREPAAWLATIARNECTARARARMREPLPLFEADLGRSDGPETEFERQALVAELQRAIATLPEKQREAVVLRDLYGLHYTEVGAALGISVASVESLLFRARRSLRVSLKPVASGALTVPIAVREGIAQALPALTGDGAGGGALSGGVGLGLLAKLAGGPAAMKAAAGIAAAVAAGSIAVAGAGHRAAPGSVRAQDPRPAPFVAAAGREDDAFAMPLAAHSSGRQSPTSGDRSGESSRGEGEDGFSADSSSGSGDASGDSSGQSGRSGHGDGGSSVSGDRSGGSGDSPSSGNTTGGGTGSSAGSGSGSSGSSGSEEPPATTDDALSTPGGSTSGPGGGGGDGTESTDASDSSGRSGESGSSESSETDNSGPGSSTSTTSSGDGGHGGSAAPPA